MASVNYSFELNEVVNLYNRQIEPYLHYPSSFDTLKSAVREFFEDFECEACGSKRISGDRVVVRYDRLRLHKDVEETGWFGRKHLTTKFIKEVYKVSGIYLRPGSLFVSPGYIACLACGWKIKGQRKSYIRWMSVNDLENALRGLGKG